MHSHTFLLLLGGLLVLAFLAEAAFSRTRIPPVLVLIGCGLILGPVTKVLPAAAFEPVSPHFGALAFLLILFEGGLELNLKSVLRGASPGLKLAAAGFVVAFVVAAGAGRVLGASWAGSIALGLALAPVSGAIVLPLAARLGLREEIRTIVILEAALADVFAVLGMGLLRRGLDEGSLGGLVALGSILAAVFSVILAVAAGLIWPRLLRRLGARRYLDALTFGLALVGWGAVELIGASGALAILVFGLTLANERQILDLLRLHFGAEEAAVELAAETTHQVEAFLGQLTFLVRAFFFVFLGVVIRLDAITRTDVAVAASIVAAWLLLRIVLLAAFERGGVFRLEPGERRILRVLQPRGLVSAVLAVEATHLGVPGTEDFLGIASIVIIATNLLVPLGMGGKANGADRQPSWERPAPGSGPPPAR